MNTLVRKLRTPAHSAHYENNANPLTLKREQIRALFRSSWLAFSASTLLALILFANLWGYSEEQSLLLWLGFIVTLNSIAGGVGRYFTDKLDRHCSHWSNFYLMWAGVSGALWGMAALYLLPNQTSTYQVGAIIVFITVALGSALVLAPRIEAFIAHSLPFFMLVILKLNIENHIAMPLILALLLFAIVLTALAWRLHESQIRLFQHQDKGLHIAPFAGTPMNESSDSSRAANLNQQGIDKVTPVQPSLENAPGMQANTTALAIMSHEVRTPISGILGMLTLLRDSPLRPVQREYLETAYSAAESLLTLVNDVLDFSKIEAGKLNIEHINFDLRRTVESVVELFTPQARGKNIELNCIIPWDMPRTVTGDPTRLRQILINLISNAIKFTPAGEVTVKVSLQEEKTESVVLKFLVRDTGVGVESTAQKKIFQPFSQSDNTIAQRFGGTGLGLSISKQLVELMGGTLSMESLPGKGSTFQFTARLGKTQHTKLVIRESNFAGLKMLLISDDGLSTLALEEVVKRWGMQVVAIPITKVADLFNHLEKAFAESVPYDMLVLNKRRFDAPSINFIQALNARAHPPLFVITETAKRGDGDKARQLGINAFLTQPVTSTQLRQSLLAVLGQQQAVMVTRHLLEEARGHQKHRILVVEDNIVNQKVTVGYLKKLGYLAVTANSGWEALEALNKDHYSLVLMDVQMPQLDGYETTRKIRLHQHTFSMPVIAITANISSADEKKCLDAGMNDYITKPLNLDNLSTVLEKWLAPTELHSHTANNIH